jgi:RHS repeat-associated protein
MPILRLDENGEPIYYLTDAMGSVIGLADGNGAEIAEFEYDSFGNLRRSQGNDLGLTGGDFRFQGQWLESNTDLYHFRARYYDPETGRFVSRDPVEIIEYEPESSNPYQFVYNNPHIYLDPSGEFTISEISAGNKIQNILQTYANNFARDFVKEQTGQLVGNVLNGIVNRLLPATAMGEHFNSIVDAVKTGPKFEKYLSGQVCGLLHSLGGAYSNYLWIEPSVNSETGQPNGNGLNCGENIRFKGKAPIDIATKGRRSRPDFIIHKKSPKENTKPLNPDAFLIGDVKITVEKAVDDYILKSHPQWQAMYKHAGKYQITKTATFITFKTFFGKTEYPNKAALETRIQQAKINGLKNGVVLFIVSIFD